MNMRLEVIMLQSYKVYTLEDGKDFVLIDTFNASIILVEISLILELIAEITLLIEELILFIDVLSSPKIFVDVLEIISNTFEYVDEHKAL